MREAAMASVHSSTQGNLVAVGIITGAHGIKGQVKIRSYTDTPADMLAYGALLNKEGTKRFEARLDGATANGLIVTLKDVKDRNAAELLRGVELFVSEGNIPEADGDEFYYEDLIGLETRDTTGVVIGKVTGMFDFGAGDIIELQLAATGKKEMFAFTTLSFPEIHHKDGYIVASLPEVIEAGDKKNDGGKA